LVTWGTQNSSDIAFHEELTSNHHQDNVLVQVDHFVSSNTFSQVTGAKFMHISAMVWEFTTFVPDLFKKLKKSKNTVKTVKLLPNTNRRLYYKKM
jgi:hypothetical protein